MADAGYSSPFPTSHDTIGQSTLVTPLFMPSSPPQQPSSPLGSPTTAQTPATDQTPATERVTAQSSKQGHSHTIDDECHSDNGMQHVTRPPSPGSPTGSDLDARLVDYTLDFSNFPSGHFALDEQEQTLPPFNQDVDKLSDVGGPEDFTANMEKYLMGDLEDGANHVDEAEEDYGSVRRSSQKSRQTVIEEETDSGEYSEFGPPVDMSTPSRLLHRTSAFPKDSTHLEGIEEYPDDNEAQNSASPSIRKLSDASSRAPEVQNENLYQLIAQLQQALKERDDQLQKNRNHMLEAVSASEHIRHLQTELQRKNALLDEANAKVSDEALLREQVQSLKKKIEEQEKLLRHSSINTADLSPLLNQISEMQQQLQGRDVQTPMDKERLETIAHLRQQLNLSQEQVRKRDETLDETITKHKEVIRVKDALIQEKNSEIDQLQAQIDDYGLENEKLESELERAQNDHQVLEERFMDLEIRNRPLEEKNITLEANLSRVQSHMEAQESALKAAAADLPISGHSTYSEILDLIKDLGPGDPASPLHSPLKDKFVDSQGVQQPQQPQQSQQPGVPTIASLRQELQELSAAHKAADTEAQTLIKTIETEKAQLSSRVDELTAALNKSQHDLIQSQEGYAESLETIARLQEEKIAEPPSPPPSPPTARGALNPEPRGPDTAALEVNHQSQLRSLQTAHSTAVSTLRASHAESMRKIRHLLTAAEQRETDLRSELATLRTSSATSEDHLRKSFKIELRRLEDVIAAKDEIAAEVDQRIALSVDKREREWERRIDLLLKERDRMAKALMMSWGEMELGRGPGSLAEGNGKESRRRDRARDSDAKSGQAYRYKYAQKQKSKSMEARA
ncbi:Spindle pole body associated protein SnaD, putative [Penicillium digitatum]|uniref:Spindle pole body associated protein SnaD, putative n=3 Tax=Penicillium digitatum TaxID=36651 RepID=K9FWU2_PEND2|nr:Spindle pole body associated protein SnaD, putative [Penicillium digitatum Pd1]EKV12011.1 Spindle pole body associated protein SnaD, putative [Penicillium digitatum Pd1]EKV14135.1 Spindle pole body associated protein SnaD, putative [Penicillium digitatum PHI26]QQK43063.1 Spindle pole body associated protein SnaD, putative [Penicillium digitatum]